ncbi:RNA polymerase sigma factor [Halpernia sp.]|uniref:RNA polymerase sigma factor n=1 Tax=Halpernia sp. TaxID=2782209 RepID=UPI003A9351DF
MTLQTFETSVFSLKDEMYRFAKKILQSSDEAEDLVQDLLLKFWQKKEELLQYANLKSYILKCVKNDCLNRLKHHQVKMNFAEIKLHTSEEFTMETNNLKDFILKYISELPEKQRLVIHLKDVEEHEISEIAEILEMEENAVRVNLMRARQKVKTQITQLMNYEHRTIS